MNISNNWLNKLIETSFGEQIAASEILNTRGNEKQPNEDGIRREVIKMAIEREMKSEYWSEKNQNQETKTWDWNETILEHVIKLCYWTGIRMYILFPNMKNILCMR